MKKKLKKSKEQKITKEVEITSLLLSFIDSEMEDNGGISLSKLCKQITLFQGGHPHINTVEKFLKSIKSWQPILPRLEFIEDKEKDRITRIKKLEPQDLTMKKELRVETTLIKDKLDNIQNELREIKRQKFSSS